MSSKITQAHAIIKQAIEEWKPAAVLCLYSGGYDSAITTHVAQQYQGMPVWSIDTNLSADGWREYVTNVAAQMGWDHHIYDNYAGYAQFKEWVRHHGCPMTRAGHSWAYRRLKERAIEGLLAMHKKRVNDKVLMLTGIRRAESNERRKAQPTNRKGHQNIIFVNPLLDWSDLDVTRYRWDHDIPENPFYGTVKGSGDCQCNWGNFITLNKLQQHAPALAAGNVADLDRISRELHGYGWDGTPVGQSSFILDEDDGDGFTLCMNCSRDKGGIVAAQEYRALQEGL